MISHLGGGNKLADKIFNKYNITKEERKEVKNEIANGGGGGDTKDKYVYYIPNNEYNYINFSLDEYTDFYALLELFQPVIGSISSKVKVHYRKNADKFKDGYYLYNLTNDLDCYGIRINNDLFIQLPSYENSNGVAHTEKYIGFNGTFDEFFEFYKILGMDVKSFIELHFKRCTKEEFYKDVLMYDLTYEDIIKNLN